MAKILNLACIFFECAQALRIVRLMI